MNKLGKYIFIAGVAGALLLSANVIFAEDTATTPTVNSEEARARLEAQKLQIEAQIQARKAEMTAKKVEVKQNIQQMKEAQRKRLEELKKQAQERAKEAAAEIKEARTSAEARVKAAREEGKKRIQELKDTKKREAATKIVAQLDRINKNWTDHFTKVLDRLDAVLQKIKSRAEKAAANGKDVSMVTTAITDAQAKIDAARTAVAAQAQKTYVLDATVIVEPDTSGQDNLMAGLRSQFKRLKEQLHKDLTTLRDGAMKDARKAVADVLLKLSNIPGVDGELQENSINQ